MVARTYQPPSHDGARYRAAIQPWYSQAIGRHDVSARTGHRLSAADLDLLNGGGLLTMDHFLQSAFCGIKSRDAMVSQRDQKLTSGLIDSGGYQISTGAEDCSEAIMYELLRYCEQFDAAPILDGPTSSIQNPKSKLKTARECFDFTLANGKYAISNRRPGHTRFLNVIQGLSPAQALEWYENIKFLNDPIRFGAYAIDDWAFAGATRTHFSIVLNLLVRMRDEKLIKPGAFLHFLGVGSPEIACALTAIQDALRTTVDENILVSCDTATPFLLAGRYKRALREPTRSQNGITVQAVPMPECRSFVGSHEPWPVSSPFADSLTLGDLNVRPAGQGAVWDDLSHALLAAHNVWIQTEAVASAVNALRLPLRQARQHLPLLLIDLTDFIREVLVSERPMTLIRQQHMLLDSLAHKSRNTSLTDDNSLGL